MDIEKLARLVNNLLRVGTVEQIAHKSPARVRVRIGSLLTDWIPYFEQRAGRTRTWNPPTVGEQGMVLSPNGELGAGVFLSGVNSDDAAAPSDNSKVTVTEFPDGAWLEYNHASHALVLRGVTSVTVIAEKNILLRAGESITLDAPQVTSTAKQTVQGLLTYRSGLTGTGGTSGTSISGDLKHVGGELSSNGVVLDSHKHANSGGSGTGGEPVK